MSESIIRNIMRRFHTNNVERIVPLGSKRRKCYDLGIEGRRILINEGGLRFLICFNRYLINNVFKNPFNQPPKISSADNELDKEGYFCLAPIQSLPFNDARIAIVIHVYYVDLFGEICSYLKNIPFKHTLLISVCKDEDRAVITKHIENLPRVERFEVKVVENRGRDIAPMLVDFAIQIRDFDFICKIHTKKSLFTGNERIEWRRYLFDMLLGSKERVQAITTIFLKDTTVGVIYPKMWDGFPYWVHTWMSNKIIASSLLAKMGIQFDPDEYIDFPAGSMFWARREALEPLLDLRLKRDDFPEELGQTDGELPHTIERCFALVAQKQGLKYVIIIDNDTQLFSYRSNKKIDEYFSVPLEEKLRNSLNTADIVSFAIFDILLERPFANPDFVFRFLEERVQCEFGVRNFYDLRIESEKITRLSKMTQGDVKISEIYSVFAERAKIDQIVAEKILELEVNTEISLLYPRKNMIELARDIKNSGKRLILTSDTYFEKNCIERILSEKGINFYDALYISSEIGKRKDRGDIWQYILGCENTTANRFLHIGNSEQSDVHSLVIRGFMYPVHIMKPSVLFRQSKIGELFWSVLNPHKGWKENLLYGMIANFFCSDLYPKEFFYSKHPLSDPFALGYTAFGPILFSFLIWLMKSARSENIRHLIFLSGEGYLLSRAFETIIVHPSIKKSGIELPQCENFLCPIRALKITAFNKENDSTMLLNEDFHGTLRVFFDQRLGVSNIVAIEGRLGKAILDKVISLPRDHDQVLKIISKTYDLMLPQAKLEKTAFLQYCIKQGLTTSGKVGIVGLRYSECIQKTLSNSLGVPLLSYYLIRDELASENSLKVQNVRAFFSEFVDANHKNIKPNYRFWSLMEAVITAQDEQFSGSHQSPECSTPIFKNEDHPQEDFSTIDLIQQGGLKFIRDMLDIFGSRALDIEFSKDLILNPYELIVNGKLEIGDLESTLPLKEGFDFKIQHGK